VRRWPHPAVREAAAVASARGEGQPPQLAWPPSPRGGPGRRGRRPLATPGGRAGPDGPRGKGLRPERVLFVRAPQSRSPQRTEIVRRAVQSEGRSDAITRRPSSLEIPPDATGGTFGKCRLSSEGLGRSRSPRWERASARTVRSENLPRPRMSSGRRSRRTLRRPGSRGSVRGRSTVSRSSARDVSTRRGVSEAMVRRWRGDSEARIRLYSSPMPVSSSGRDNAWVALEPPNGVARPRVSACSGVYLCSAERCIFPG
jgi:hypothetical protein